MDKIEEFKKELRYTVNRLGIDSYIGIPDNIITEYLLNCLVNLERIKDMISKPNALTIDNFIMWATLIRDVRVSARLENLLPELKNVKGWVTIGDVTKREFLYFRDVGDKTWAEFDKLRLEYLNLQTNK